MVIQEVASVACVSCGQPLTGRFCAQCGERALANDEHTFRRFLADTFQDVTNVDAKLYRTLWLLVRRPGLLTVEYLRGRRVPYLRPVQLFLLANLVYFVVQPITGYMGFNTNLAGQMDSQFYSQSLDIRSRVEQRVAQQNTSHESYETAFNRRSSVYARSLTALLIPFFSVAVALMFVRKRRPFANHVVFASHFLAWQLVVVMSAFLLMLRIASPYLFDLFEWASSVGVPGMQFLGFVIMEFGSLLIVLPYLYSAVATVYGSGRLVSASMALALTMLLLPVMLVYRFLLFWLTFATV